LGRTPHNRWATFSALSLLFFVVTAGAFSSLGVVLPAMVRDLGWNWTQAGFGYTLLGLTCGLASVAPAVLIRRIGVRGTMIAGTVLLAAGFAAMALTQSLAAYFAATLLIGTAFALCSTVPGTHVLTGLFEKRSTVLGAYFTIGAFGAVAAPLFYVAVKRLTGGWRPYWTGFLVLAVVAGLFAIVTAPGRGEAETGERLAPEEAGPGELVEGLKDWSVRRALATPQFYVIVAGYTAYLLILTTARGFAVEHLRERGIGAGAAAGMLSLEALIGAGVSVIGGMVGEKISPKVLMIASLLAATLGVLGLAQAHGWDLMLVYAAGVGVGFGLSFIASAMLLLTYFGKRPNLELYSIMTLVSTAAALGPAVGGWVRDRFGGFSGVFLVCAALSLAALLATAFMRPPRLSPAPPADR
jgi:MFS family permease